MLLLQTSHAENVTSPNCDQYIKDLDWAHWPYPDCLELPRCMNLSSSYETCKTCGGRIIGHENLTMICIPSNFKQILSYPPYKRVPMKLKGKKLDASLTDIYIIMRDVQVISIGMSTITISMNFDASWFDYRLKYWNYPPKDFWTMIWLGKEFRKLIWFPDIISKNVVSEKVKNKQFQLLRLGNNPFPLIISKFYLSITVNCEMDFETYPFDEHVCNLEVCILYKDLYFIVIFKT